MRFLRDPRRRARSGRSCRRDFGRATGLVLAAHDGPLWTGPLHAAGPVRAVAELASPEARPSSAISVEPALRRRGVGTYLVQTAARLLAPRGVSADPGLHPSGQPSFLAWPARAARRSSPGRDEVEVTSTSRRCGEPTCRRRAADVLLPRRLTSGQRRAPAARRCRRPRPPRPAGGSRRSRSPRAAASSAACADAGQPGAEADPRDPGRGELGARMRGHRAGGQHVDRHARPPRRRGAPRRGRAGSGA